MHGCDDPEINKLIEQQGWNEQTVLQLLWSYLEADPVRVVEFQQLLARTAAAENEG